MNTQAFWRREAAQVRDASGVLGRAEVLDTSHLSPGGEDLRKEGVLKMTFDMPPRTIDAGRLCPIGSSDGQTLSGNIYFEPDGITEDQIVEYVSAFRAIVLSVFPQAVGVNFAPVLSGMFDQGQIPDTGNHVHLKVGMGANNSGRPISHVSFRGSRNTGYMMYDANRLPTYAAHEFGHLCGLAERYAEGLLALDGQERNPLTPESRATLPLVLDNPDSPGFDPDNDPMSNLMANDTYNGGSSPTVTPRQMNIVMDRSAWEPAPYSAVFFFKKAKADTVHNCSGFRKDAVRMNKDHYVQYFKLEQGLLVPNRDTDLPRFWGKIGQWCKFGPPDANTGMRHGFVQGGGVAYKNKETVYAALEHAGADGPLLSGKLPNGGLTDKNVAYNVIRYLLYTNFLGLFLPLFVCCSGALLGQPAGCFKEDVAMPDRGIRSTAKVLGDIRNLADFRKVTELRGLKRGEPVFLTPIDVWVTDGLRLEDPFWGIVHMCWDSKSPYYERPADVPDRFMFPSLTTFRSSEGSLISPALVRDMLSSKYLNDFSADNIAASEGALLAGYIRAPLRRFKVGQRGGAILGDTVPDALKACALSKLEVPCKHLGAPGPVWPHTLESIYLRQANLQDLVGELKRLQALEMLIVGSFGSDSLAPRLLLDLAKECPNLWFVHIDTVPCRFGESVSCWYIDSLEAMSALDEDVAFSVQASSLYEGNEDEDGCIDTTRLSLSISIAHRRAEDLDGSHQIAFFDGEACEIEAIAGHRCHESWTLEILRCSRASYEALSRSPYLRVGLMNKYVDWDNADDVHCLVRCNFRSY